MNLIGCRDDSLLEPFEIFKRSLAGRWRGPAGKFDYDKRMAQYAVGRSERLKHWLGQSEMRNPD
jgi:hypothetical protein